MITEPINNKRTGRKLSISIGLILASVIYAFYQNTIPVSSVTTYKNTSAENSSSGIAMQTLSPTESLPATRQTKTKTSASPKKVASANKTVASQPAPKPTPPVAVKKPAGRYADGTYAGSPADAFYGTIQVQAIVQNGVLADVQFLQYPNDRNTSIRVNSRAMPILKQEAISAQSANVNIVSGATDSSQAFQQSLASALSQA